ncbi:MAG: hypothetical protein V5804_10900 [Mucilaginibacter sp.]|uniref:hypothetical protein n=1 Tax=Mucilaginibacter sp. TaxID=1882438 RepID=UPI0034E4C325
MEALLAAVCCFLVVLLFTKYSGIGVSPDSVVYTSVARNLNSGLGMLEFGRKPLIEFPVGFPIFLAIIQFFSRLDPIVTAPYVTASLFAAVVFCTSFYVDTFGFRSVWYKYIVLITIVLSPSLLEIYTKLWSETLFILLVMLFLLTWKKYVQLHRQKWLMVCALIAAVSCITRYAGITLVLTGSLLLVFDLKLVLRQKIKHFLIFNCISVSLLAANLFRNALLGNNLTGNRQKSIVSLMEILHHFGATLSSWLTVPDNLVDRYASFTSIFFLSGFVLLFCWRFFRSGFRKSENIAVGFFLVYTSFIIISSAITRYETINNRLLAPAFIPFLLGASSWLFGFFHRHKNQKLRYVNVLFLLAFLFLPWREYKTDDERYYAENEYGVPGYTDDSWNNSPFAGFLRKHQSVFKPNLPVYSNSSDGFYFFSGLPCQLLPNHHYPWQAKDFAQIQTGYLVWFDAKNEVDLLSIKEISALKNLKLLYKLPDGKVYLFTKRTEK